MYYAHAGEAHARKYSGRLVLKPTPHLREQTWALRPDEAARFPGGRGPAADQSALELCAYMDVDAAPGWLVLFPAWLPHAVLPARMEASEANCRVSVAFNVNLAP